MGRTCTFRSKIYKIVGGDFCVNVLFVRSKRILRKISFLLLTTSGFVRAVQNLRFLRSQEAGTKKQDSPFWACLKSLVVAFEIAARFFESLAMTQKCTFRHCEERSDEAISPSATSPFAGMTNRVSATKTSNEIEIEKKWRSPSKAKSKYRCDFSGCRRLFPVLAQSREYTSLSNSNSYSRFLSFFLCYFLSFSL